MSFDLRPGEVHVLMGENGAGKSTLMKVLAGAYVPDDGELYISGEKITKFDPISMKNKGSWDHLSGVQSDPVSECC